MISYLCHLLILFENLFWKIIFSFYFHSKAKIIRFCNNYYLLSHLNLLFFTFCNFNIDLGQYVPSRQLMSESLKYLIRSWKKCIVFQRNLIGHAIYKPDWILIAACWSIGSGIPIRGITYKMFKLKLWLQFTMGKISIIRCSNFFSKY